MNEELRQKQAKYEAKMFESLFGDCSNEKPEKPNKPKWRIQLEAELKRDGKTIELEFENHILILMHDEVYKGEPETRYYSIRLPNGQIVPVHGFSYQEITMTAFKALVYALNYNIETGKYHPQVMAGNDK